MIFHIHAFIYVGIVQLGPNYLLCHFPTATYTSFVAYVSLAIQLFFYSLLAIFGLLTVKNMQRGHLVIETSPAPVNRGAVTLNSRLASSKDRQLILICLTEMLIYVVFASPQAFHLIYIQATQYQIRDAQQTVAEQVTDSVLNFSVYIPYAVSFYSNILISKNFRSAIKNLFTKSRAFCFGQHTRVEPIAR
jgi:hypothetical protein